MLAVDYAFAGLGLGAVAAVSGVGVTVTYRATGVVNLAHGAIAMLGGYAFWQLADGWQIPRPLAAVLVVLVAGPVVGAVLERLVFRPLQRRYAGPTDTLVATVGVLVLLIGVADAGWGAQTRHPTPLFPRTVLTVDGATVHVDALAELATLLAVVAVLVGALRLTALGTQIRAVVDRRDLAELAGIDAGRVAALGWAIGSSLAALTGVLLAAQLGLDPFNLTLVVLETIAVPVVAALTSVPLAIAAGVALGVGMSEMNLIAPSSGAAADLWNAAHANAPVVVLLVAVLARRRIGGGDDTTGLPIRGSTSLPARARAVAYPLAAVALAIPPALDPTSLHDATAVPALGIIFVSLVALTGYTGQISLGQAAYAGLGGLVFAHVCTHTSQLAALLAAAGAAGAAGAVTAYPAIRRRGLALALTTFAVGVAASRFVFQQPALTNGLTVSRPTLFGLSLRGDRAFYLLEIGVLLLALLVVRHLRHGVVGRVLRAVRDSEDGARAVGVDVRAAKVLAFTVSATLAGLGGALLVEQRLSFTPGDFDPLAASLPWFATVVVAGAASATGAFLAAAAVVALERLTGDPSAYEVLVGVAAVCLGRLPGGFAAAGAAVVDAAARAARPAAPAVRPRPVLTERGREALERMQAVRAAAAAREPG